MDSSNRNGRRGDNFTLLLPLGAAKKYLRTWNKRIVLSECSTEDHYCDINTAENILALEHKCLAGRILTL